MVRPEIIRKRLNKLDEYLAILEKDTWIRMIGFRNILVHDYLEVDRRIVYEILQHRLDDLKQIRDVFVQFL